MGGFSKRAQLLSIALLATTACQHIQGDMLSPPMPQIKRLIAPEVVELPKAIYLICEVENTEDIDLQFKWETTSGVLLHDDSSTVLFLAPSRASRVTVQCSILDSSTILDQKSVVISAVLPAFVGDYILDKIQACDSTYTPNNRLPGFPNLLLEIYDTHTFGKGFAYSWKVSSSGLPTPDSCFVQFPGRTHNGFMGKWGTEADSLLFFSRPIQLGAITQVVKWSMASGQLILEKSQSEIWYFSMSY